MIAAAPRDGICLSLFQHQQQEAELDAVELCVTGLCAARRLIAVDHWGLRENAGSKATYGSGQAVGATHHHQATE